MVSDIDVAIEDAARAKAAGADVVEFRVDPLAESLAPTPDTFAVVVGRLVGASPLPAIVTCRITTEGGMYSGDDGSRAAWLRELLRYSAMPGKANAAPMYIDIEGARLAASVELTGLAASLHATDTRVILSSHDFGGRPMDLSRRLLGVQDPRGSIAKVVYRARSLRDSLEILDIPGHMDRPTIALGMGEFGLLTRVLAPKFGGFLTFASLAAGQGTAPGQPTIDDLLNTYGFRSIGPETKVYGVIGWPVSHSKGPAFHNAGFREVGHDGVYLPLPIAASESDLEATYASLKATLLDVIEHPRLNFRGASVTIPFKENLLRLAAEQRWGISAHAQAAGAANTIVVNGGGISVDNTDWLGFADPITRAAGNIRGKRVLVLGAGGAARTAAAWAWRAGALVSVANRTRDRADRLKAEVENAVQSGHGHESEAAGPCGELTVIDWDQRESFDSDVVIHATSLGMSSGPSPDESPLSEKVLASFMPLIFETVYSPRETPLLRAARAVGCPVIDGMQMFEAQAAAQFEAWVGKPPPMEVCRGAVERCNGK